MLTVVRGVGHRPELEGRELLHVLSEARLAEQHRPRRVVLDPPRDHGEERRREDQEHARPDDVDEPLDEPRRPRDPQRAQAEQRQPFDGVDVDVRRHHFVEPRNEVDLHVQLPKGADQRQGLLVRVVGEGEDDPIDAPLLDELEQLVRVPQLDPGQLVALLEGMVVDDPDQADPVLRVQEVLPCDQLADVAAADHDRVLHVRGAAADDAAADRAADGDEERSRGPRRAPSSQVGMRDAR